MAELATCTFCQSWARVLFVRAGHVYFFPRHHVLRNGLSGGFFISNTKGAHITRRKCACPALTFGRIAGFVKKLVPSCLLIPAINAGSDLDPNPLCQYPDPTISATLVLYLYYKFENRNSSIVIHYENPAL